MGQQSGIELEQEGSELTGIGNISYKTLLSKCCLHN